MSKITDVYDECSSNMADLSLKMESIVNDIIVTITSAIKKNQPQPDGLLQIPGSTDQPQSCWPLYDNGTCNDTANTWTLLIACGAIVLSKSKTGDRWSYDNVIKFGHTTGISDANRYSVFHLARTFFGLLRLGKRFGVYDKMTLRMLENDFSVLYGQYSFIRANRRVMTGMK